ncbi:MAG: hypothetical protein ACOYJE_01300 [Bacteroidaceae bacterium]|jgi:hypothetical protein
MMHKNIFKLFLFCMLLPCGMVSAQEKPHFSDYLAYFPTLPLPTGQGERVDISDTLHVKWVKPRIPKEAVRAFLTEGNIPNIGNNEHIGIAQFKRDTLTVCIACKIIYDCDLPMGIDYYDEYFLVTYAPDGRIVDWERMGMEGAGLFLEGSVELAASNEIIFHTRQISVREYEWNRETNTVKESGTLAYYTYRINKDGIIFPKKEKHRHASLREDEESWQPHIIKEW